LIRLIKKISEIINTITAVKRTAKIVKYPSGKPFGAGVEGWVVIVFAKQ